MQGDGLGDGLQGDESGGRMRFHHPQLGSLCPFCAPIAPSSFGILRAEMCVIHMVCSMSISGLILKGDQ